MEYLTERGVFTDLPLQQMFEDFAHYYAGLGDIPADAAADPAFSAPEG